MVVCPGGEHSSPSKAKHCRGQTFTVSKMLSEVLPDNIQIPVIRTEEVKSTSGGGSVTEGKENCNTEGLVGVSAKSGADGAGEGRNRSRLAVPKTTKLPGLRRDNSKSKLPRVRFGPILHLA